MWKVTELPASENPAVPVAVSCHAEDVAVPLQPGSLRTVCAYKGAATHWTATLDDGVLADIAWSYPDPLEDAERVRSLVAFYQERLDVFVDGRPLRRVRTPWS